MFGRLPLSIIALLAGIALASFIPGLPQWVRTIATFHSISAEQSREPSSEENRERAEPRDEQQGTIRLTAEEVEAAGIEVAPAQSGTIAHRILVPGTIVPQGNRIAHVAVKLSGIVAELRKNLGDMVDKDEVLAILESRDVADAKSEYLAARLTNDLQQYLFERDKTLWDKKISTEQQFLRSRNQAANAKMRFDIARQKLFALGLTEAEIAALPNEPEGTLRRQEVRSPIAGRVVERKVELGVAVGRDQLETELFVIADLQRIWVDLAVSPADLPLIREGQSISVTSRAISAKAEGKVVFISPMLDKETSTARVIAEIENNDGLWRPGSFVTAAIAFEEQAVPLVVPATAIQTLGNEQVAFVRTEEGFAKRRLILGQSDDSAIEVLSGLRPGEIVAVSNTFPLKAELLKSQAED
jgi:cobalt-zinc-cadmium efflux system membrane fusion protein